MSIMDNLYYHIHWPNSQYWMQILDDFPEMDRDAMIILGNNESVFVDKDLYEHMMDKSQ